MPAKPPNAERSLFLTLFLNRICQPGRICMKRPPYGSWVHGLTHIQTEKLAAAANAPSATSLHSRLLIAASASSQPTYIQATSHPRCPILPQANMNPLPKVFVPVSSPQADPAIRNKRRPSCDISNTLASHQEVASSIARPATVTTQIPLYGD